MLNNFQNPLALVGRILLALMFVLAGISKLGGFAGTVGYIGSKGLPMPAVLAALTIVLELGGGLALVFGFCTRWVALAMGLFTLLVSVIFHNYWTMSDAMQMTNQLMFMKNMGVAGGMFMVAAFGAGALSLDARRAG